MLLNVRLSRGSLAILRPMVRSAPPVPSNATAISPDGPSASNTVRVANDAYGTREAVPDNRQPLPSRSNVSVSALRTGPIVIGPSLVSRPQDAATQPASMVSANGMGAENRPATRKAAYKSDHSASAPPADSDNAANGTPVSATTSHNP